MRAEVARAGMSGAEMARTIGMSYDRWARRMARPELWTVGELTAIASVLGLPLTRFVGTPNDRPPVTNGAA